MAEYELQNGITSIHPATMTLSEEELTTISKAAKTFHEEQKADETLLTKEAELVGIYMEGPFISMEKKGAQNPLRRRTDYTVSALWHRKNLEQWNLLTA